MDKTGLSPLSYYANSRTKTTDRRRSYFCTSLYHCFFFRPFIPSMTASTTRRRRIHSLSSTSVLKLVIVVILLESFSGRSIWVVNASSMLSAFEFTTVKDGRHGFSVPTPTAVAAVLVDSKARHRDQHESNTFTQWVECIPSDDDNNDNSYRHHESKLKKRPRSKLVLWGAFEPSDPFQTPAEDGRFLSQRSQENQHPLRTDIWEFDLKWFKFPFFVVRMDRHLNESQISHRGPATSVKLHIELHPSGLCRAMISKTSNPSKSDHLSVKRTSRWTSLLRPFSRTSKRDRPASSLPVAYGNWKNKPWGVIIRLCPLDWNSIDDNDDDDDRGQKVGSELKGKRRRKTTITAERTARLVSSQEYILTAKAFNYDFYGSKPTLSQGTIVWVDKSKRVKKMQNNGRPIVMERDVYSDVPLVDRAYFGNLGWGKQWFLPVVGTFTATGALRKGKE
jgi:hypothetical protein